MTDWWDTGDGDRQPDDPTVAEIVAATASIRAGWSRQILRDRRGLAVSGWTAPTVTITTRRRRGFPLLPLLNRAEE